MSFDQLKKAYKKQLAIQHGLLPTPTELEEFVAERLLQPFDSMQDALAHAAAGQIMYTAEGWEVSPNALKSAVRVLSM